MKSVYQSGPSERAATLYSDGMQCELRKREDSRERHYETRRNYAVVGDSVCGGPLLHEKGEAIFAFAQMFDIVHPGNVCIRNDVRLRKRSKCFLLHCDGLPDQLCPLRETLGSGNTSTANHVLDIRHGAIAPYAKSVSTSHKQAAQSCNQSASGIGGHYPAANDAPLVPVISPSHNADGAVELFNVCARGKRVRNRNWLGVGLAVLSHHSPVAGLS